jgi:hypothetical protein
VYNAIGRATSPIQVIRVPDGNDLHIKPTPKSGEPLTSRNTHVIQIIS